MTPAPANARLRRTKILLAVCLAYAAGMVAVVVFLVSQHAWTLIAAITASSVAPLSVSMSAYAAARRGSRPAILEPRSKGLFLFGIGGGVMLGAGIMAALLLVK